MNELISQKKQNIGERDSCSLVVCSFNHNQHQAQMNNFVQEYLKNNHSLKDLETEYHISSKIENELVILKYDQEESPKTDRIVRQSRGTVLELNTWNFVHYPFYRFYNFGEVQEEEKRFDWDNAVATEKIDGSITGIFNHKGEWHFCTSSQIGGCNIATNAPYTFRDLAEFATKPIGFKQFCMLLNPRYDYTFELVSPFNRLITPYEKTRFYLIGCRDKENGFREIPFEVAFMDENIIPSKLKELDLISVPKSFNITDEFGNFKGFDEMIRMANLADKSDDGFEGFVVVDYSSYDEETGSFPRIKVKSEDYLACRYLHSSGEKNSISYEDALSIIYQNEVEEFLSTMPHFSDLIMNVKDKWDIFCANVNRVMQTTEIASFLTLPMSEREKNKKCFAMLIKDNPFKDFLFIMYNHGKNSVHDAISILISHGNEQSVFKKIWKKYLSNNL